MVAPLAAAGAGKAKQMFEDILDDTDARIKNMPAAMILGTALIFEFAQFVAITLVLIPLLGFPLAFTLALIVTITAYTLLYFTIAVNFHVTPFEGNWTALGLTALEFVPGISGFLPGITGSMGALIVGSRLKDKLGKAGQPALKLVGRQRREMGRMRKEHRQSEKEAYKQSKKLGDVRRRENEEARKEKAAKDKKMQMASVARSFDKVRKKQKEQGPAPYSRSVRPGNAPPPANDNYESEFPGEIERYDDTQNAA